MGISSSFDLNRISNLENRANSTDVEIADLQDGQANKLDKTSTAIQPITYLNITGLNNSLTMTAPNTNTQWCGGMEDPNTYYWALGKFHSNVRDVELRAYMDNLVLRSGRKAGATAGGITFITNDALTAGINSDITITCNTGGQVRANCAFNGSAFNVTSDSSYKNVIEEMKESALDLVKRTKVKKYHLKNQDKDTDPKRIGLIREEAPEQIHANDEQIDLYQMASLLWKSVQELSDKLDQVIGAAAK
jgi:transposase